MATNLALDDGLIDQVKEIGGFKTKRDAVNAALNEFIRLDKARRLIDLAGTIEFDPVYDYKEARRANDAKRIQWDE